MSFNGISNPDCTIFPDKTAVQNYFVVTGLPIPKNIDMGSDIHLSIEVQFKQNIAGTDNENSDLHRTLPMQVLLVSKGVDFCSLST